MKKIKRKLTALALLFFSLLFFLIQSMSVCVAFADSNVIEFEKTNVLDDLKGTTINGKLFSTDLYTFDERQETQVLSFVEYCYSDDTENQENYNLYVYVYNPKNIDFVEFSDRNSIEIAFGDSGEYNKYDLLYLNKSEDLGFENLYYKYKVSLSSDEKKTVLTTLNSQSRVYHISGIELLINGEMDCEEYTVNAVYTYNGFAVGYGNYIDNPLSCTKESGIVLNLKPYQTFYRPNGFNGTNSYTQDCLASVYFSIPNSFLSLYGDLSSIDAEFFKARTAWGLVTGNKTFYEAFLNYIGLHSDYYTCQKNMGLVATQDGAKIVYNLPFGANYDYTELITYLPYLFFSGDDVDSADNYEVSSLTLLEWMRAYKEKYDNIRIVDYKDNTGCPWYDVEEVPAYYGETLTLTGNTSIYSRALFQSWVGRIRQVFSNDNNFSLTSTSISQNYWQKLWGDYSVDYTKSFDGIKAIHKVSSEDFGPTPLETCRNLYIGLNDFQDFYDFYNTATKNNETVFLFRYDVGEYSSIEVHQGTWDFDGFVQGLNTIDTNGYLFQSDVYLGFDIIDVDLGRGKQVFTIPVVMSPIDMVPSATPPLVTTTDHDCILWKLLAILIIGGLLSWLLNQIFPWFYPLLGKIIAGAFKVIWYIISFKWLRDLIRWKKGRQPQQVVIVNNTNNKHKRKGKKKPSNYRR